MKTTFKLDRPRFLVFPVTYRCNSRCKMCSIWALDSGPEMSVAEVDGILQDKFLAHSIEFINITGGECFLRKDLHELTRVFVKRCPNLIAIMFASNGFATKSIVKMVDKLIALTLPTNILLSVGLSFDGLEEVHDRVRGIPGGFGRMKQTLEQLRQRADLYGPKFAVGVGTNVNAITLEHLEQTYAYFRAHDLSASFTPAVASDLFFQNIDRKETFELTPELARKAYDFFHKLKREGHLDSFYFKFAKGWLLEGKRSVGCVFQTSGIFLEPNGDVYPCMTFKKFKLGNLLQESFSDIWRQDRLARIYREMAVHCSRCGTDCYIEKASLKNRLKRRLYHTLMGQHALSYPTRRREKESSAD